MDNQEYIIELDQLDRTRTIGVHGTSVEAAKYLLETGTFSHNGLSVKTSNYGSQELFFTANVEEFRKYFKKILKNRSIDARDYLIEGGKNWGSLIGFRHYMAMQTKDKERLPWEIVLWEAFPNLPRAMSIADCPRDYPYYFSLPEFKEKTRHWCGLILNNHVRKKRISEKKLNQLIAEGVKRKGCLIGLNEKALELKISEANFMDDEAKVIVPKGGLTLDYVNGIVPLGEVERRILADRPH